MAGIAQVARLAIGLMAAAFVRAQQSTPNRPIIPVIGKVKAISGDVISVATRAGMEDVATDAYTEVWSKTDHDVSPVQKAPSLTPLAAMLSGSIMSQRCPSTVQS